MDGKQIIADYARLCRKPSRAGDLTQSFRFQGVRVVCSEFCDKETVSMDGSDGICKDGTRDGGTGTQAGTLDNWLGVLSLQSGVKFEMVNVAMELLGRSSDFFVWVPLVSFQYKVLQEYQDLKRG